MADIDLKTETPDTTINDSAFLFGADSQSAASPSVYSVATVKGAIIGAGSVSVASAKTLTASNTLTLAGTDSTTMTFPSTSASLAGLAIAQTFTAKQTIDLSGEQLALGGTNTGVFSLAGSTSGKVTIQAANAAGTYTLTLPTSDGDAGQFLKTDGSGVLSWDAAGGGGTPGGSDTQVQFNDGGSFGGDADFTWDKTNNVLTLGTDARLRRRGAANLAFGAADAAGSSIAISAVDTTAETLTVTAHGLTSGAAVQFITTGSLPGGLTAGVTYFARVIDADTIEVYSTYDQATAASGTTGRINLTSAGSNSSCQLAAPFQTLGVQDFTGTNIPGQPFIIRGSQGTGTGAGGSIIFQVAPAGSSGTAQNALATALTINSKQQIVTSFTGTFADLSARGGISFNGFSFINAANTNQIAFGGADGVNRAFISASANGYFTVDRDMAISWASSQGTPYNSGDVALYRDAANTLAQRNGANAQESRVYGSYTSATNFQRMSIKTLRESSGALSGATYVTTIAIPAYANLIGVTTRVTTEVTGATTYDVGDGSDVDLWGAAIGVTLGSQSRTADFTAVAAVGAAATSRTVTLTANGSNFTGGVIEICLHYLTTEAD